MAEELYQVRTANGALLVEYKWHVGLDRLVQRFALRWAGFERDGFIAEPANRDSLARIVERGTLIRVPALAPAKLLALHTTPITERKVFVLAACEVGGAATAYLVQSGEFTSLCAGEDGLFTTTMTPSLFSYESWRGAKSQMERLLLGSSGWAAKDVSAQAAWPDLLLATLKEEQRQLAARPVRSLNAEEFAKRMRAMRAMRAKGDVT